MADTVVVPPRISNTPPPIDSSFEEGSNNSKSAEDFNNNLHLDDSDIIDNAKLDDVSVVAVSNDGYLDENLRERSDTITNEILESNKVEGTSFCDNAKLDVISVDADSFSNNANIEEREPSNTILYEIEEEIKVESKEEVTSLSSVTLEQNKEEDSFNLSDDKLKTIIDNFKISSADTVLQEETVFFKDEAIKNESEWNPFGGESNDSDWAAFETVNNDNVSDFKLESEAVKDEKPVLFESNSESVKAADDDDWDNFVSIDNTENYLNQEPIKVQEAETQQPVIDAKKNDEIYFENFIANVSNVFATVTNVYEKKFEENNDQILNQEENYLFKDKAITDQWNTLLDFKNSESLKFVWRNSKIEELYLNSINIDKKIVNTTSRLLDVRVRIILFI